MAEVIHRRSDCRGCGSRNLDLVLSLRPSPIGDAYVTGERVNVPQASYPIDLFMCGECGLAQLLDVIKPEILYGDYIYVTGSSLGLDEHFESYAKNVLKRLEAAPGLLVVDLGSNDGTLLQKFKQEGMRVLGVEPAAHIAAKATKDGIPSLGEFFSPTLAKRIVADHGAAAVVTANVFANIDDLASWVSAIDELLAPDGVFVFESFYLADLLQNMVFDFIYHEHLTAFSVRPVQALFGRFGLELVAAQRVATKGGSLRYFVQRPGGPLRKDGSIEDLLASERKMGLYDKETYARFADRIDDLKKKTRHFLEKAKMAGKSIAGFGASITGTTLIYHFEIGEYLEYLVDDNPAKQGRFSPGLHLPVYPSSALDERHPDCVVLLAWRYAEPFMNKHKNYMAKGGQFMIPVPEFRVVGNSDRSVKKADTNE